MPIIVAVGRVILGWANKSAWFAKHRQTTTNFHKKFFQKSVRMARTELRASLAL